MSRIQYTLSIAAGLLIMLTICCAFLVPLPVQRNLSVVQEELLDGWTDEQGNAASLFHSFDKDRTSGSFSRMIDGSTVNGRSLCLISHNICFTVWLGDVKLYDYRPALGGFYGKRYGEDLHTITLPTFTDQRLLRMEAVSLRNDGSSGCNEAWLIDSHAFMQHIEKQSGLRLCLCILAFFFGVMLFVIGIIEDRICGNMIEAICLGAITLITSAWIGSQTLTIRVLCHNSGILRVMEYFALDVLPIPMLVFSASFTKNLKHPLVMAGVALSVCNLFGSIALVLLGVIDYSDGLIVTHSLIVAGVLLIIWFIIKAIRNKTMSRRKSTYLISAASLLSISGLIDIIRYYLQKDAGENFSLMTEIGMFAFSAVLAVYEFQHIVQMQVRSGQAELMRTLAMEDTLTKLGSRAAFVAFEKELMERAKGMCLFVHFDVNYLKQVNDVYGHAEGDRHLIAAAKVLRESFAEYGKLFRVGGDEFYAVLDNPACRTDYLAGIERMKAAQTAYNQDEKPPVPLAIAHGMAEYDYTEHNPENAERLADSRMYEEKRRMKEQTA